MAHPGCIPFVPLTPLSPLVPLYPCVEWKHIALPKMNELEISTRMLAALEYTAYRSQRVDLLNKSIDDCRSPTLVRFGLCLVLCKFCLGHRLVCLEFSLDFFDFGFVSREESFDRVDNGSGGIVVEVLRLSDYPCSTRGQSHRPVRYVLGAPWHVACSTKVLQMCIAPRNSNWAENISAVTRRRRRCRPAASILQCLGGLRSRVKRQRVI